jgi:hypothetical protein
MYFGKLIGTELLKNNNACKSAIVFIGKQKHTQRQYNKLIIKEKSFNFI